MTAQVQQGIANEIAIAYCNNEKNEDLFGIGRGKNQATAQISALEHCNRACCKIIVVSTPAYHCVAIAAGKYGSWANNNTTLMEAKADSLRNCKDPDCNVLAAGCAD